MTRQKVFCIGLGKTGTTSLKEALRILGYRLIRLPLDWKGITDFDAALPGVSAAMFAELDAAYPDSKFILTVRDEKKWLKSVSAHLKNNATAERRAMDAEMPLRPFARAKLYNGDLWFNEEHIGDYLNTYREYNRGVEEYFRDRDDLLILDIEHGDGWEKICDFLGRPVPDKPLPWKNRRSLQRRLRRKLKYWKRKLGLSRR